MTMKLLHALIVVLTALLFLVRKSYLLTGIQPIKRQSICPACSNALLPDIPRAASNKCCLCNRAGISQQAVAQPKYKRDPEITVDNEDIVQNPHDYIF